MLIYVIESKAGNNLFFNFSLLKLHINKQFQFDIYFWLCYSLSEKLLSFYNQVFKEFNLLIFVGWISLTRN